VLAPTWVMQLVGWPGTHAQPRVGHSVAGSANMLQATLPPYPAHPQSCCVGSSMYQQDLMEMFCYQPPANQPAPV
jgi:hypothetical protein